MKTLNKFERSRVIGARALQISMGAPILVKHKNEYNPIKIAKKELEKKILPITVREIHKEEVQNEDKPDKSETDS
jgi:DNA-directed RNA polymerase subunit K